MMLRAVVHKVGGKEMHSTLVRPWPTQRQHTFNADLVRLLHFHFTVSHAPSDPFTLAIPHLIDESTQ